MQLLQIDETGAVNVGIGQVASVKAAKEDRNLAYYLTSGVCLLVEFDTNIQRDNEFQALLEVFPVDINVEQQHD